MNVGPWNPLGGGRGDCGLPSGRGCGPRVADRELILVAGDRDLLAAGAMAGLAIATID